MIDRALIGRELLTAPTPEQAVAHAPPMPRTTLATRPDGLPVIDWSLTGVEERAPRLVPTEPPCDSDPLPSADVVVITWTAAEWDALHYVFCNDPPLHDENWQDAWWSYRRDFQEVTPDLWTRRLVAAARNRPAGAPALLTNRWGAWRRVDVGERRVLLFKSDLHLNQDGERIPLLPMLHHIVEDAQPELILSIGTGGGLEPGQVLGDAVVSRSAQFRLGDELRSASFNRRRYTSTWVPNQSLKNAAEQLFLEVPEFAVEPPTAHFPGGSKLDPQPPRAAAIQFSDKPILTTDFFEFGTTTNGLDRQGCMVEMDDALVAMVAEELGVKYGFVRNVSDPVINGTMSGDLQAAWAVVTYAKRGRLTSYNGAIATWSLIAA